MRKSLLALALCAFIIPSCKKSDNNNQTGGTKTYNSVNDIKVPSGFNWESSRNVAFKVDITDDRFAAAKHTIAVYNGNPFAGGTLLGKGAASTAAAYEATLSIAKTITEVYVLKSSPDNSQILQKVTLGAAVAISFGAIDPNEAGKSAQRDGLTALDDCNSGCTNTITANTSNVSVSAGNVICITGSNITVSFSNVVDGTIRVCGSNVTLQNLNLTGMATLLVLSGGSANVSGLTYGTPSARIINYGTMTGLFTDNGYLTNYGTFNCTGDFNVTNTSQTFVNNGTINVSGNFTNSSLLQNTNNGTLSVSGNFMQTAGSGPFVNYCSILVAGNYTQNMLVKNHSYIRVTGTTTVSGNNPMTLHNGAMLRTNNLVINNGTVEAYGSTSLVKVAGTITFSGASDVITGLVQVCATTPVAAAKLQMGATNDCSLYIPASGCNSDGSGSSTIADADGDGIADNLDDYPGDASKAYNNYYPSVTGGGTVAFEDQWPTKGDFDMNDVVVGYRYQVVTNAANNVVKLIGNYTLLATGGSLGNGFGVQFPVNSGNVSNVTGGTLEASQNKAVVIVFNNMRDEMANWNTVLGATTSPTRNYTISFDVTSGPSLSTFGLSSYNPFIWNFGLGNNRGREIHLAGHAPTDLGFTSYFGTADDSSVVATNRYYVTKAGLPYAIDIPVMPFNYPVEQMDITKAFLHFGAWGESGGATYADWYSNMATDYRNTANIYH